MKLSFEQLCRMMPMPGVGAGYHANLMTLANKARNEGLTEQVAFDKIREATPTGGRTVEDGEIWDTIRKAYSTEIKPKVKRYSQIEIDKNIHEVLGPRETWPTIKDIMLAPRNLHQSIILDTKTCLRKLFDPEDKVFIGMERDNRPMMIQSVADYTNKEVRTFGNYIIANPLDKEIHYCKDGVTTSYRCDDAVCKFKYCIVEFDEIDIDTQIALYAKLKLPIVMLVHSGGKSIHGWIRVEAETLVEWQTQVDDLYNNIFAHIGADTSCRNASRLTRTPGVKRINKDGTVGDEQKCLYLRPDAPEGCALS